MQILETFKNKNKMTKGDTCSREIFEENVHFSSICKVNWYHLSFMVF